MEIFKINSGRTGRPTPEIIGALLLVLGIFFLFTACKSDGNSSENPTETAVLPVIEPTLSETSIETSDPSTAHERRKGIPIANKNGTTGGNSNILNETSEGTAGINKDLTYLFSELEMTSEQIYDLKNAMESYQENLAGSSSDDRVNSMQVEKEKHLKNILSDKQFKKYRSMQSKN